VVRPAWYRAAARQCRRGRGVRQRLCRRRHQSADDQQARLRDCVLPSPDRLHAAQHYLSVRRPGVTVALDHLSIRGLITKRRGIVKINDRAGLQRLAGRSYGLAEREYAKLIGRPIKSGVLTGSAVPARAWLQQSTPFTPTDQSASPVPGTRSTHRRRRFSRSAFVTTVTEEAAIAAPASIGDISRPVKG
jgi:hypothetical protein